MSVKLRAEMIGPMSNLELNKRYFVLRGRIRISSERTSFNSGSPASYKATKFLMISIIWFNKLKFS